MLFIEFLLDAEESCGISLLFGYFSISEGELKGKEFDIRLLDIFREAVAGAFGIDATFGAEIIICQIVKTVEDAIFHFGGDIFYGDGWTLITEIGAAFIACPSWIQCAVMGEDFEGDHVKLMKDVNEDMEDFIIEAFANATAQMGESSLTGDAIDRDAGICAIGSAFIRVVDVFEELIHILIAVEQAEQVQEKETYRVITRRAEGRITLGH